MYNQMKDKKYLTIYKEIKEKILSGEYEEGAHLPSKRVLADKRGVSVITTEKAYNMLLDEGYITARERSGYFVSKLETLGGENKKPQVIKYLDETEEESEREDFEYSLWFKTIRKVISEKGEKLFSKAPGKGVARLRNAIAGYLLRYRGMVAQPERIIIGSGAEQLYEMVVKILGRDKLYGIEDPSYPQIETVYSGEGARIKKLKLLKDGIAKEELLKSGADVLHVTPFKSFPTEATTTATKKREYLSWAEKSGAYIVEDDFNSEFFIPGQPVETLYSLDGKEKVIYINTFSKSLSPSMRMGYMILPEHLLVSYEEKLGKLSCSVPVLDQYVLAEFIENGSFERYLNRMRRQMRK